MTDTELITISMNRLAGLKGLDSEGGGSSADAYPSLEEDIPSLIAEVHRLRKLVEYARHKAACSVWNSQTLTCNCGYEEALT